MKKPVWTIAAIAAVFGIPLLIAGWMTATGYRPGTDAGGVLLATPRLVPENLHFTDTAGQAFEMSGTRKWTMVQSVAAVCPEDCLAEIRLMQAVHSRTLGNALRLRHALWPQIQSPSRIDVEGLRTIVPSDFERARQWLHSPGLENAGLWVVDPRGHVVLGYLRPLEPKKILADLKTLLSAAH
ncbi:MAG: hypothetical protein K0U66_07980 [Gammaproteobacteria bacterium]|nr:hypothetical protein [Pseudomonadota bacterium]MCH9663579.1 hypothetical protein [Gammaproteobacteria bacterium]